MKIEGSVWVKQTLAYTELTAIVQLYLYVYVPGFLLHGALLARALLQVVRGTSFIALISLLT